MKHSGTEKLKTKYIIKHTHLLIFLLLTLLAHLGHKSSVKAAYVQAQEFQPRYGYIMNYASTYKKDIEFKTIILGEEHASTAQLYHNLGWTQYNQENYPDAIESYKKAIEIYTKVLGEEHKSTATSYNNLGYTQYRQGDHTKALASYKKAVYIVYKSEKNPYWLNNTKEKIKKIEAKLNKVTKKNYALRADGRTDVYWKLKLLL